MHNNLSVFVTVVALATPSHAAGPAEHDIVDTAVAAGQFGSLAKALTAANLVDPLKGDGPFTVFAPTDDAFGKLPKADLRALLNQRNRDQLTSILTYHVVPGEYDLEQLSQLGTAATLNGQRIAFGNDRRGSTVDGARILQSVECENGIIHVIDSVLVPEQGSLAGVARKAGNFETLITAVKAAGLADALMGDGPFTVFAPTDEAFAKIDKKTLGSLLEPKNRETLAAILKYHVVPGRVFSDQAAAAGSATTLQGAPVSIAIRDGRLRVADASVVANDIEARNGVIHVIDTVLMPPAPPAPKGRKYFGISYAQPSAALATQLGLDRHNSLMVTRVINGSEANNAGLQRYDVITKVDGRKATDDNVTRAKKDREYGDAVPFEVVRGGRHVRLEIAIGEEKH